MTETAVRYDTPLSDQEESPKEDEPNWALRPDQGEEFAAFYKAYSDKIVGFHTRRTRDPHLGEDLAQDTFIKAMRYWNRVQEEAARPTWLYRIATTTLIDNVRRRTNFAKLVADASEDLLFQRTTKDPEDIALRRDRAREIGVVLDSLPGNQGKAIALGFFGDLSGPEASREMGIAHPAYRTLSFRARRNLRNHPAMIELNNT